MANRTLAHAWERGGDVFSPELMIQARFLISESLEAYHSGDFLAARLYAERATADARLAAVVSETERLHFRLDTLHMHIQAYRDTINRHQVDRALLEREILDLD